MVAQSERERLVPDAGVEAQVTVAARAQQQSLARADVRQAAKIAVVTLQMPNEQRVPVLDVRVDLVQPLVALVLHAREEANEKGNGGTHGKYTTGMIRVSEHAISLHSLTKSLAHLASSAAGTSEEEHVVQRQFDQVIGTSQLLNGAFSLQRCRWMSKSGSNSPVAR